MWDAEGFEGGIIHGGTGKQLGVQLLGITVILAWVCATIGPTFGLLKYFNMLRLSTELQISVHVRSVSPPAIECIAAARGCVRACYALQSC
jgi:ammonia channel protein AmtB